MSKPACIEGLTELALNLRWSWTRSADDIWGRLEPELWELTHNPWAVLQTVSPQKLETLGADPSFCGRIDQLLRGKEEAARVDRWFQTAHPNSPLDLVAYFSMEYMLSEALPIYSGGLGNVAGDQLKAASDLGVPVIGVGLLYQQGYFRQEFDASGAQLALYPYNEPGQLPIQPLRDSNGQWVRLPIPLPAMKLWIRAWQVEVGSSRLYVRVANDPANPPGYSGITSELYGGGPELRLRQEYILGIVGWRLLRTLGLNPEVCHLNEGHAAFAVLERARWFMHDCQQPFDAALAATRAGNVFTTHTAVEAGFDRFDPALIEKYLRIYAEKGLRISFNQLLALENTRPFRPLQHGLPGDARQRFGERRQPPPRRSEPPPFPAALPAPAAAGSPRRLCHQRRARGNLGMSAGGSALERRLWGRPVAGRTGVRRKGNAQAQRFPIMGVPGAGPPQPRRIHAQASRPPACRRGRRSGRTGRSRPRLRPRRVDARFCAPLRHVQAPDAAAARPRAARPPAHQPRPPGSTGSGRQSASAGFRRAGHGQTVERFHPPPGRPLPRRLLER